MLESRGGGGESGCIQTPPPLENSIFFNLHFFSKLSFEPPPDGQIFWIRGTKKKEKKDFYPTASGRPANKFLHLDKHNKKIMKNR